MKKTTAIGLAGFAALLLAGCGSIDQNRITENIRDTETSTSTVTKAVQIEEVQTTTSVSEKETTTTTASMPEQTKGTTTTSENIIDKPSTLILGMDDMRTNSTVTSAPEPEHTGVDNGGSNGGTILLGGNDEPQDGYEHDKPMGNEVLPQSVDYYATETQPLQTEPPVAETPSDEKPAVESHKPLGDGDTTSKGYKVEVRDGVTYIDGIIIANKSYDLPENYGSGLVPEAQQAFNDMQTAAANDGIWLSIVSGYRSYWYQDQLYWGYVYSRGGQAITDTFSARAGHSEHQTGLAMDLNNASRSFAGTPEAEWIEEHCAEYGFIIRYPDGKQDVTGFVYEPWHVRYLGKDLAKKVTDSGLALEEYLGIYSEYEE